jgi:pyruvate,water dikinase
MLPGAVTPLALSTSVEAIDYGIRQMMVKAGGFHHIGEIPPHTIICSFSNNLFINLVPIYRLGARVAGASKEAVEASICGKVLKNAPPSPWKDAPALVKAFNLLKYGSFMMGAKKARKKAAKAAEKMNIPLNDDPAAYYRNISAGLEVCREVVGYHFVSSAHSGAMSSAAIQIMQQSDKLAEAEARAKLASFLEDIDGIESADILKSLRVLASCIVKACPDAASYDSEKLASLIKADKGDIAGAYQDFMARHGHRAVREAEIRSKSWAADETAFLDNLHVVMGSLSLEPSESALSSNERPGSAKDAISSYLAGKKGFLKKGLSFLINQSREAVVNREFTKSKWVLTIDKLKRAYARLAGMLVSRGLLPRGGEDLIYFLTHEEIGLLINEKKSSLVKKAMQRRRLLSRQMELRYPELTIGKKPEPLKESEEQAQGASLLSGLPVSRGRAQGRALVVQNLDDARKLRQGDIMVAPFTDIGWSPYYSLIGGLITEVGSALSHGAVVAREYGLPVVANVANATRLISSGATVKMDGTSGQIAIVG